jgi:hypothetical protein
LLTEKENKKKTWRTSPDGVYFSYINKPSDHSHLTPTSRKRRVAGETGKKMSKEDLLLLDFWVSPFCMRVKIALAEKGWNYESKEEDLFGGKSELLLKSNPVYQKVPVLLHNGKPLNESSLATLMRNGLHPHCCQLVHMAVPKPVSGLITLTRRFVSSTLFFLPCILLR